MNRLQFWMINCLSFAFAALLLTHHFISHRNEDLGQALTRDQAAINAAQPIAPVLDQLAKRIAYGSETDPQLKNILIKYGLKVTLDLNGEKKSYP